MWTIKTARSIDICQRALCLGQAAQPGARHHELPRLKKSFESGPSVSARELTGDGPTVFEHVCRMGLEGIVSKRTDAPYRSGPSRTWLKSKNPASVAVRREREEEWR